MHPNFTHTVLVTTIPLLKMQHRFIYLNKVAGLEAESAVHITALSEPFYHLHTRSESRSLVFVIPVKKPMCPDTNTSWSQTLLFHESARKG